MPSPFPGMDPYLEGSLWQSVHLQLSMEIARQLAPKLRPRYLALTPERYVYEVPDVSVEIHTAVDRQLVTGIEVLSPTNKRGDGRTEYLAKRRQLLLSTAHLMEIDLLREGERVPMQRPLPSAPYFIFLSRVEDRPVMEVWPVTLDQPLPSVPVPLLPGDPDVMLDLQQAFTTVYQTIGYDLAVDYSKPAEVPLPAELAGWVAERLAIG